MTSFSLSSYTFSLRREKPQRRAQSQQIDLSKVSLAQPCDLLDAVRKGLERARSTYFNDNISRTALGVTKIEQSGRTLSGFLDFGRYGMSSRIYDTQSSAFSYDKKDFEAEILPFYYLIHIPRVGMQGVIFLQRTGLYGLADEFPAFFESIIQSGAIEPYIVNMTPTIPASIAKDILQRGRVKKIRYTSFKIPDDIADAISDHVIMKDFEVELVLSARRNRAFGIKQNLLKHLSDDRDFLVSFQESDNRTDEAQKSRNIDPAKVKLEVSIDGSNRVINLSDIVNTNPYYNITQKVKLDNNGVPQFESIDKIAKEMLAKFIEMLGLDNE